MAASNAAASDQIVLSVSKTRDDYRLSLALLLAGIVVYVASSVFVFWANSTGNYPTSIGGSVALTAVGGIGITLIIVGAIFSAINWSLLKKSRATA